MHEKKYILIRYAQRARRRQSQWMGVFRFFLSTKFSNGTEPLRSTVFTFHFSAFRRSSKKNPWMANWIKRQFAGLTTTTTCQALFFILIQFSMRWRCNLSAWSTAKLSSEQLWSGQPSISERATSWASPTASFINAEKRSEKFRLCYGIHMLRDEYLACSLHAFFCVLPNSGTLALRLIQLAQRGWNRLSPLSASFCCSQSIKSATWSSVPEEWKL